jgi:alpha-tubulin suppressor-like RCC1 family protein
VFPNYYAFVALKDDGSTISWGQSDCGGDGSPSISGVADISSSRVAFAALKKDGTVVAWGKYHPHYHTHMYSRGNPSSLTNVKIIYASGWGFAALKNDGTVYAWGDAYYG